MAMGLGGLRRTQSNINMTPLIDVLLVLLIIFMTVTPILTRAMNSDIPQKVDQPIPEEYSEKQLVVHIDPAGTIMLNREPVTLASISSRLREIFAQRGGKKVVFLDADNAVLYGTVVQVMDLCREGGAETIGVVPDAIGAPAPAP
jgi:biopolymer transport protein ExbD